MASSINTKTALAVTMAVLLAAIATGGYLVGRSEAKSHSVETGKSPVGGAVSALAQDPRAGAAETLNTAAGAMTKAELLGDIILQVRADLRRSDWDGEARSRADWRIAMIRPEDIPLALELIENMPGGYNQETELTDELLAHWAKTDGRAACEFSLDNRNHAWRSGPRPVRYPLLAWARAHPQAALEWFLAEDAAGRRGVAVETRGRSSNGSSGRWIFQAWVGVDLDGAIAAFNTLSPAHANVAAQGFALGGAAVEGRTRLLDLMFEKTSFPNIDGPSRRLFRAWVHYRPEELAEWVDGSAAAERTAPQDLLSAWVNLDSEAASEWWLGREVDVDRSTHVNQLIFTWARDDPFGAAEWMAQQKLDAGMAPAMESLAKSVAYADPVAAFAWALRIEQDIFRDRALNAVVRESGRWNRTIAEAALRGADLPQDEREDLLDLLKTVEEVR